MYILGYTAFIESDEDLSQSVDFQTESNPKKRKSLINFLIVLNNSL